MATANKRKINDLSNNEVIKDNINKTTKKRVIVINRINDDYNINNNNTNNDNDEVQNQISNDDYYDVSKVNIENLVTTETIANNLREFLSKERIKHEIFSKSILNCSKSTLARLLYEPKTWQTINDMWKLYFKIIYLWLNDKKRLDKLKFNKRLPKHIKVENAKSSSGGNNNNNSNTTQSTSNTTESEFDIIETYRSNK